MKAKPYQFIGGVNRGIRLKSKRRYVENCPGKTFFTALNDPESLNLSFYFLTGLSR